ncbi:MAG: HD domain-containing protein [Bacteroidales bacterium]|nr:HD domain-containing protein [Bacteroidales bacterium]
MSDTRALLNRISAFRQRLESTPPLTPARSAETHADAIPDRAAALSGSSEWLGHSLRLITGPKEDEPLPSRLTVRARRLLEDAQELVAIQKRLSLDPTMVALSETATVPGEQEPPEPEPIVTYHRATVALTETALRLVQSFPESAEMQIRLCEGLESLLQSIRERLGVAEQVLRQRTIERDRVSRLSRFLTALAAGQPVSLQSFATLAEEILDETRRGLPIRFLSADPFAGRGQDAAPPPAEYIATCSLTVAQVVARLAPHDYEWASRPLVPVVAALLMDVGMLKVPATVLGLRNALTAEEYRQIERHPTIGAELVRRLIPEAGPVADAIAAHHERLNGTGYPQALSADAIPSLARLLAVADTYAAMVSDRPHRAAFDPRDALTDILLAAEQGRLDGDIAESLLHLSFHPIGTVVELSDGRVGTVVAIHQGRVNLRATSRPVIAILTDERGELLARPEYVDLATTEQGAILRALSTSERRRRLASRYPNLCG